jgi:hypothetical protein
VATELITFRKAVGFVMPVACALWLDRPNRRRYTLSLKKVFSGSKFLSIVILFLKAHFVLKFLPVIQTPAFQSHCGAFMRVLCQTRDQGGFKPIEYYTSRIFIYNLFDPWRQC